MPLWRVVGAGWASLEEMETTWSMDDMVRANALLDMKDDVEKAIADSITPKEPAT